MTVSFSASTGSIPGPWPYWLDRGCLANSDPPPFITSISKDHGLHKSSWEIQNLKIYIRIYKTFKSRKVFDKNVWSNISYVNYDPVNLKFAWQLSVNKIVVLKGIIVMWHWTTGSWFVKHLLGKIPPIIEHLWVCSNTCPQLERGWVGKNFNDRLMCDDCNIVLVLASITFIWQARLLNKSLITNFMRFEVIQF